jgi:hypothetical protein
VFQPTGHPDLQKSRGIARIREEGPAFLREVNVAYDIQAEPGETVLLDMDFEVYPGRESKILARGSGLAREAKRQERLRLAISDRAIYLPATRFVVSGDATYFRRVSREDVREVRVQTLRPYGMWVAAALMVAAGLATEIAMMWPLVTQMPGTYRVSGWPLAILVVGLLLPFAARGRQRLAIQLKKGRFGWNAPLVMDRGAKQRIAAALDEVLKACQAGGYQVMDDRATSEPQALHPA